MRRLVACLICEYEISAAAGLQGPCCNAGGMRLHLFHEAHKVMRANKRQGV